VLGQTHNVEKVFRIIKHSFTILDECNSPSLLCQTCFAGRGGSGQGVSRAGETTKRSGHERRRQIRARAWATRARIWPSP
jgi:hypothetical protein